jgi:hypothetical protein
MHFQNDIRDISSWNVHAPAVPILDQKHSLLLAQHIGQPSDMSMSTRHNLAVFYAEQ